jgi:hypothetical protein
MGGGKKSSSLSFSTLPPVCLFLHDTPQVALILKGVYVFYGVIFLFLFGEHINRCLNMKFNEQRTSVFNIKLVLNQIIPNITSP